MPIEDLAVYQCAWRGWWSTLQLTSNTQRDYECLRKKGKNGFFVVMMSLVWWGVAAKLNDEWKQAVADVTVVLRGLKSSNETQGGTKRKRISPTAAASNEDEGRPARSIRCVPLESCGNVN